jgi:hypothetical protein
MASIVFREIGFIFLTFFKYLLLEPGRRETQKLAVKNRGKGITLEEITGSA